MYTINDNLRKKIYDGGLEYTPIITIGNTELDWGNIEYINIDDPIIDKQSQTMYIGTFISKKLEMKFRKPASIDLSEQITYSIKITDETFGYDTIVPIGVFNIETSPQDYYATAELVALDNAVKFKPAVNIQEFFDEETEDITALALLQALCTHYGVTLVSYPNVNTTVKTASYDSTTSGKQYISYIAEIMGGFAKIDRQGRLKIVPVKSNSVATIDATKSKALTIGEEYKITEVCYDNGDFKHTSPETPETGNTLYIRTDNIFINGTDTERQQIIDNIYDSVGGLTIRAMSVENYADFTLDSEDIVAYTVDEDTYLTYYNNSYAFKGSIMGKVDVSIPTKNQEETTNVLGGDLKSQIKGIRTTVDQQNARFTREIYDTRQEVRQVEEQVETYKVNVELNNLVVSVDTLNIPIETKTYSVNYTATYLGETVNPVVTYTGENIGITVSVNTTNKTLNFGVSNTTTIPNLDNRYVFTFTYTLDEQTYVLSRTIILSLVQQGEDGDDGVVQSGIAPTDTTKIWYDTATNTLRRYDNGEWVIINDYSTDLQNISENITNINTTLTDELAKTNSNIETVNTTLHNELEQTASGWSLNLDRLTETVTNNANETTSKVEAIQDYLKYQLETIDGVEKGVITLGASNSSIKLKLVNNILYFEQDGVRVAYISDNKLYITDAQFLNSIIIGNFAFIPRTNGSLSFRKVG